MEHKCDETQTDARPTECFDWPSLQRAFTVFSFSFPLLRMAGKPVSIYLDMLSRTKVVAGVWDVILLAALFNIWSVLFFGISIFAAKQIYHEKDIIRQLCVGVIISAYTVGSSSYLFPMMGFVIVYKSFELNLALCVLVICVGLPVLSALLWVRWSKLKLS